MSIKVSVITPTYRETAIIEQQVQWLRAQTLGAENFEWLLLDDLYAVRKKEIAAWNISFLRHLSAPNTGVRGPSKVINRGLVAARGEIVYFMTDYMQIVPTVLERHWTLYQEFGPAVMIAGPVITSLCPVCLQDAEEPWPLDSAPAFLVRCVGCRTPMIFLRQRPYEYGLRGDVGETYNKDLMRQAWWVGRNESVPLAALVGVNGLDESMDGRGGDSDLGTRLMNWGCRFITDLAHPAIMLPHHRTKPEVVPVEQIQVAGNPQWEAVLAGATWADNGWSIQEERARGGGTYG